jgi:hypothetical protein
MNIICSIVIITTMTMMDEIKQFHYTPLYSFTGLIIVLFIYNFYYIKYLGSLLIIAVIALGFLRSLGIIPHIIDYMDLFLVIPDTIYFVQNLLNKIKSLL